MTLPTATPPDVRTVSYALTDAYGAPLAGENVDRPFYAASTIKLHVLLAALGSADDGGTRREGIRGEGSRREGSHREGSRRCGPGEHDPAGGPALDLDTIVPATRTFTGTDGRPFTLGGDHLDPTHPADGEGIRVRELLVRMIDRSSNEATNHVIELIGLEAVAEVISILDLESTRVERLIGDEAALGQGRTNETSAADLVATMRALVAPTAGGTGLSAGARNLAREALAAQRIRFIGPALRPEVAVGSKSGWVDGYRHDVAVIGDPDGDRARYLAVMTAGMAEAEADEAIRGHVRALLPHLAR